MKPYLDSKKLYNLAFFAILIALFAFLPLYFSRGETAEEIRIKIEQKSEDIAKLEEQIKAYQQELESLGRQKNSLSVSIKELDLTKKKLTADISITQKKIDKTNLTITNLSRDIGNKQVSIENNISSISAGIRETEEYEMANIIETLLSRNDFTDIWTDIDHIAAVREKMTENILRLKEVKSELEDTHEETVEAKNELVALRAKLSDQQKLITQTINEKNRLLSKTKNNESNYQKLVKDQLALKLAFERELRSYESALQFILDPSKLPSAGVLSWPLDYIFVTQEFGAKTGPHRTYASGHSGTDFRARTPVPVKAMADGIVKGVGDTDASCPGASFGKWIFIEYSNGLSSTFGHLSLQRVSEGQRVSRGQVVGYTGGTGRVTGPHLHVSLYVSSGASVKNVPSVSCPGRILRQPVAAINAYLDPMYYLPSR